MVFGFAAARVLEIINIYHAEEIREEGGDPMMEEEVLREVRILPKMAEAR